MTTHSDIAENGNLTGIRAIIYDDGLVLRYRPDNADREQRWMGCWSGPSKVWAFVNGTFGRDDIRRENLLDALRAVYEFAAEWLGLPREQLAAQVESNFLRLFA